MTLVRPRAAPGPRGPLLSASGSVAVTGAKARVARAGRIYVEGRHDAELVERVWGHDLRVEGVVVEYLEGVDDLPAIVSAFSPAPDARLGVLVDHLVPGSKESRIAASVTGSDVLVVGHPYIDVWEAVKPSSVGIPAWPRVPARPGLEDGRLPGPGLVGPEHGRGVAAHPGVGALLQGPPAGAAGAGGGADRLRHGALTAGRGRTGTGRVPGRTATGPCPGRTGAAGRRQSTRSRTTASASSRPRRVRTARPSA